MENPSYASAPVQSRESISSSGSMKNFIIILLTIILILSLLGINIFTIFGNFLQKIIDFFNPVISKGLSDLGYASGTVIDKSSDILADTSKVGIDILHDTVDSVGSLLIKASGQEPGKGKSIDIAINKPPTVPPKQPEPDASTSPIQTTPSCSKNQWCLVGEYNGTRGCVNITDQDKCMSGQVFPTQQLCLNPTMTQR
jgi:hypothetical protein